MTPPDDYPGDMHRHPFDAGDADVVFGSSSGSVPVPEELRDITELVNAARRTGSADELVGEDSIVAQITAAIGGPSALPDEVEVSRIGDTKERIRVLSKFRTAKLAAATTAMVVMGATAAAAATCSLPSPVQNSVSKGLSGVGISVPARHAAKLVAEHDAPVAKARHHKAEHHGAKHHGALGVVASVNGVSDPGTCGVLDAAGTFTLTGRHDKTFTVNVDTTTAYRADDVTDPSFANVCVGSAALAKGDRTDMIVAATKVIMLPPKPVHEKKGAFGTVASVNGVSDPGTCGVLGAAGTFTLTGHHDQTFTVNVDPTTPFSAKDVTDPSFANLCVGVAALAKGTVADTTVTAASVVIAPERHERKHNKHHGHGVFGTVASVNGLTDPTTCGTAGAVGSFTLNGWKDTTFTVNVTGDTKFYAFGTTDPSFANICVGAKVGAKGDVTDTTVAATVAFVLPEHAARPDGDKHHGRKHGGSDHKNWSGHSKGSDASKDAETASFQGKGRDHGSDHNGSDRKGHDRKHHSDND